LFKKGIQLVTKLKKNMRNRLMPLMDKILLRKRSIIETVNDQLTATEALPILWLTSRPALSPIPARIKSQV